MIGIVLIALILVGVGTVLSMQDRQKQPPRYDKRSNTVTKDPLKPYVTSNDSGDLMVVDRKTGQSRELTPEEKRRLAAGLKQLIKNTDEGMVEIHHKDGSVSMDLKGHYHNVAVAKREADGSISQSCVNDLESAAAFFEIDPKLLGIDKQILTSRPLNKPEEF